MFWAMGAILFQLHAVPQAMVPSPAGRQAAPKAAEETIQTQSRLRVEPASAPVAASEQLMVAEASGPGETAALQPEEVVPMSIAATAAASALPVPTPAAIAPAIAASRRAQYSGRITDGPPKQWVALAVSMHSAAAFDAWSTRRAITQGGAQELNPMLRPFAGNRSIYAATQVGPALLDVLSRKMMTSQHPLLRRTWWLPQVLGTAASLAGGMHNLSATR